MTGQQQPTTTVRPRPVVEGFPRAGRRVEHAYRELDKALYGSDDEKRMLGSPRLLARPWDPPTCMDPELRADLWDWLDRVVTWLNHEYVWDTNGFIPSCWPEHPHLVHDLAVLADQRRRAGLAQRRGPAACGKVRCSGARAGSGRCRGGGSPDDGDGTGPRGGPSPGRPGAARAGRSADGAGPGGR